MPTAVISSECHRAIKQYLVDIEGYEIGEFIEDAVFFAMEHLEEFEEYAEIEGEEQGGGENEGENDKGG